MSCWTGFIFGYGDYSSGSLVKKEYLCPMAQSALPLNRWLTMEMVCLGGTLPCTVSLNGTHVCTVPTYVDYYGQVPGVGPFVWVGGSSTPGPRCV